MNKLSDAEFLELWAHHQSVTAIAKVTGLNLRALNRRRRRYEADHEMKLEKRALSKAARYETPVRDGVEIIFSDAHYWPGQPSTAHRALVLFIQNLYPMRVHADGDMFDGAGISRFPSIGWESFPTVEQQIVVTQERLSEVIDASPDAEHIWELGNHDLRYETYLAAKAPEFKGVHGFHLQDKFPDWIPSWTTFVGDQLVVKHRFKGGINSALNNALWSGRSIATGHDHMLGVKFLTDYNGTRFGVNTGTLAEVDARAFTDYTEDNPKNWQPGFVVLTYKGGRLLTPEPVRVSGPGLVEFRGEIIRV